MSEIYFDERGHLIDNGEEKITFSRKNVFRGMHFQYPHWQGKLVTVLSGSIQDYSIDLKTGNQESFKLNAGGTVWIPRGKAHGFFCFEDSVVRYRVDDKYYPGEQFSICIPAMKQQCILSEKDRNGMTVENARMLVEEKKLFTLELA